MTSFSLSISLKSDLTRLKFLTALNKMGDYHYYGHSGDTNLKHALKWYGKGADQKHPQVITMVVFY